MKIPLDKVSILLVDDKPDNLTVLEAVLGSEEYNPVFATSGAQAVELAQKTEFAAILLDVQMPGKDGFETAREIRRGNGPSRNSPIIFLTAIFGDETYVNMGYEAGAVDYIFKPFSPNILKSKVAIFAELFRKSRLLLAQSEHLRELERKEKIRELSELKAQNIQRENRLHEKYRNLINSIDHCIVWSAEPETLMFSFVSPQAESLTGFPLEQWKTEKGFWVQRMHHDDLDYVLNAMRKLRKDRLVTFVHRFKTKDSRILWFQTRIRLAKTQDETDEREELRGLTVDITAIKEAENTLRRSEERQRFLADSSVALNRSGLNFEATVTKISDIVSSRFGEWSLVHVLDDAGNLNLVAASHKVQSDRGLDNFKEMFPYESAAHDDLKKTIAERRSNVFSIVPNQSASVGTLYSWLAVPLLARNNCLGTVSVLSKQPFQKCDIATVEELACRAALSMENATLYKKIEKAVQIRDEFLSIASHELKTPLTPLKIQLQTLARLINTGRVEALTSERTSKMLARLDSQLDRLTTLIDNLLNVSRINLGHLTLDLRPTDISQMIKNIADEFKEQLANASCTLELELDDGLTGEWDSFKLEQVLVNLLTNAIKYGSGSPIRVTAIADGDRAVISFEDHGIGIDPKDQKRIFDLYERAASVQNYGGLGLGLYICSNIVKQHGGSIHVESKPGDGSKFSITLPLKPKHIVLNEIQRKLSITGQDHQILH